MTAITPLFVSCFLHARHLGCMEETVSNIPLDPNVRLDNRNRNSLHFYELPNNSCGSKLHLAVPSIGPSLCAHLTE
jgi:hypothetical protein